MIPTPSERKIQERIGAELFRRERQTRYLVKRSEEAQALEAVFDSQTLFTLYSMINRGLLDHLNGVVKAGKEARVYWGVSGGKDVAVKIFYTITSSFKKRSVYMAGDKRFKTFRRYGHSLIFEWVRKEYKNLMVAYQAKVPVPKPHYSEKNVLVMQFIGEGGKPAPTLAEVGQVTTQDYKAVVDGIEKLYTKANLVHGDLSEFNIFKHEGKIVFFDFASAVETEHPMAETFLKRDIRNINTFFSKAGVRVMDADKLISEVTSG